MTKEQLQAENAALRELLAAASAYADLPHAADHTDAEYVIQCEQRLDVIAIYANGDQDGMDPAVYALVLGDRAKELRERAARPVRYQTRPVVRHRRDQPASPDAAGVLAAAIAAGTPVQVTNTPHDVTQTTEASCRAEGGNYICNSQRGHDGPCHVAWDGEGNALWRWPVTCGARPYPAGSEGDDGTECMLRAGHDGSHDDMPASVTA